MKGRTLATLAGILALVGCATLSNHRTHHARTSNSAVPEYTTNAYGNIRETSFSDRDFNVDKSVVKMPTGEYIFGEIQPTDRIMINGAEIEHSQLFPMWGIRRNELLEMIDPQTQENIYTTDDDMRRVWVPIKGWDSARHYINTKRTFREQRMPRGHLVANIGGPQFFIDAINFNIPDYESVPFETVRRDKQTRIVLTPNYRIGLDHRTNRVRIYGKTVYIETEAKYETTSGLLTTGDFASAEIVQEPVSAPKK